MSFTVFVSFPFSNFCIDKQLKRLAGICFVHLNCAGPGIAESHKIKRKGFLIYAKLNGHECVLPPNPCNFLAANLNGNTVCHADVL